MTIVKFILGVVVGVALVWLYRTLAQEDASSAAELFPPARDSMTTPPVIDPAPIPPQVQDAATSEVTSTPQEIAPAPEASTKKPRARAARPRDQSV